MKPKFSDMLLKYLEQINSKLEEGDIDEAQELLETMISEVRIDVENQNNSRGKK